MGLRPRGRCRKLRLPAQGADWQLKGQEGGTHRAPGLTRTAGNRGPAEIERGTEDISGGVYTRDPVTDSRGERENESVSFQRFGGTVLVRRRVLAV